jgi:hypothetical protein
LVLACLLACSTTEVVGVGVPALALVASNLFAGVLGIVGIFRLDLLFSEILGAIRGDIG